MSCVNVGNGLCMWWTFRRILSPCFCEQRHPLRSCARYAGIFLCDIAKLLFVRSHLPFITGKWTVTAHDRTNLYDSFYELTGFWSVARYHWLRTNSKNLSARVFVLKQIGAFLWFSSIREKILLGVRERRRILEFIEDVRAIDACLIVIISMQCCNVLALNYISCYFCT